MASFTTSSGRCRAADPARCLAVKGGTSAVGGVLILLDVDLQVEAVGLRAGIGECDIEPVVVGAVRGYVQIDEVELQVRDVGCARILDGRGAAGDGGPMS